MAHSLCLRNGTCARGRPSSRTRMRYYAPNRQVVSGTALSPPAIPEQQAQEQRVSEVLDSLRRLLDSPQRILSHVRLDSTHGTSRRISVGCEIPFAVLRDVY